MALKLQTHSNNTSSDEKTTHTANQEAAQSTRKQRKPTNDETIVTNRQKSHETKQHIEM